MPKNVFHLFHDDDASLATGSHVALRVQQIADEVGTEVEVFCFGPAQRALTSDEDRRAIGIYNETIDELVAAGVKVAVCRSTAEDTGTVEHLRGRGIDMEYARDAFARYAVDGATVISF